MLYLGESLEVLKTLEPNSIDAVVTDPPYGLSFMNKKWDANVPSMALWQAVFRVLKPGGHLLSFGGTRTYHHLVIRIENAGFEIRDQLQWLYGSGFPKSHNLPGGLGTALKPANEPIVLARKPLSEKTVAANVLKWGTGALNIDGSRIASENNEHFRSTVKGRTIGMTASDNRTDAGKGMFAEGSEFEPTNSAQGRWPANLLLDERAAEMLDEQSGVSKSTPQARNNKPSPNIAMSGANLGHISHGHADSGGASRFFYCAKSSRAERNRGLEGMPEQLGGSLEGGNDKRKGDKPQLSMRANHHPTVKPIKLMEYLCRLITPPGGTVLDPFMGSGSTGVAAKNLGFRFVGIEMNPEYLEIAKKKIGPESDIDKYGLEEG